MLRNAKVAVLLVSLAIWQQVHSEQIHEQNVPEQNAEAVVVLLYDDHCKTWCEKVRPILRELKERYGQRVSFAELNTAPAALKDTKKLAKDLGVSSFLADYCDFVPYVGVFNQRKKLIKELQGPKDKDIYVQAIEKVLAEKK